MNAPGRLLRCGGTSNRRQVYCQRPARRKSLRPGRQRPVPSTLRPTSTRMLPGPARLRGETSDVMRIETRLIVMNLLQFFVWGSWLISFGAYLIGTLGFSGSQVGSIYATMGIGSILMPGMMGIVADRWVNAERVYGVCHLLGAGLLLWGSTVKEFDMLYPIMLLNAMLYMPTIALNNAVSYRVLSERGMDLVQTFPRIRVWGTVGFIAAMWLVDLAGLTRSASQLHIGAGAALLLGLYAFTMPRCPPAKTRETRDVASALGLDALALLRRRQMVLFFLFAMLLGAALQIT